MKNLNFLCNMFCIGYLRLFLIYQKIKIYINYIEMSITFKTKIKILSQTFNTRYSKITLNHFYIYLIQSFHTVKYGLLIKIHDH